MASSIIMKSARHLLLFLAVALALTPPSGIAAGSGDKNDKSAKAQSADGDGDEDAIESRLQMMADEALKAMQQYSADQRSKGIDRAKQVMDAINNRIAALEERVRHEAKGLDKATRKKRQDMLQQLRNKQLKLAEWYGGLEHGAASTWDETKKGFSDAYDNINNYFNEALLAFNRDKGK